MANRQNKKTRNRADDLGRHDAREGFAKRVFTEKIADRWVRSNYERGYRRESARLVYLKKYWNQQGLDVVYPGGEPGRIWIDSGQHTGNVNRGEFTRFAAAFDAPMIMISSKQPGYPAEEAI